LRICHYVPHGAVPDIRGFAPAIVAQNFAKFLKEDAYVISALENYHNSYEHSEYGDVYRIEQGFLYRRLFTKMTRLDPYPLYARAAKIVRQNPVDVFHAHQLEFPVSEFRKMVAPNTKIVVHAHVTRTFDPKRGKADAYIAVSKYIKNRLIERGFDDGLISVVSNGVDTELFCPASTVQKEEFRQNIGIPRDAKIVLFAGRKQEIKGFEVFLEVGKKLLDTHENVFLIAVGPEPADTVREKTYPKREETRAKLKATNRFFDLPSVPHVALADFFRMCDIAVFPSKSEPQGMVMLEAMSCGAAVVSSKTGGIVESIDDKINGFLADKPENIDEFFGLVDGLLSRGDYESICLGARQKILDKFAWERVGADLKTVYNRLLS
jgi:UDP-glucose:(glucosyl)LPS alpha-1,2-glucosyltransferase